MTRRRIEELLSREGPRIRKRFRQVMQRTKDRWTVAKLEQALAEGRLAEVLDDVEAAAKSVAGRVEAVQLAVSHEVADYLSTRTDKLVSYDGTNPRAAEVLRANRIRRVTGITEPQREAILDVLMQGVSTGAGPREQARAIRESLGLTRKQSAAVQAYRAGLEAPTPLNADTPPDPDAPPPKVKPPRPQAQVDRMVERYADRQVAQRAEAIARTEALRAVHEGSAQAFGQAVESGVIAAELIVQRWHAGTAPRTRPSHVAMNGQERPWGESFISGDGVPLRWPGDAQAPVAEVVQCRCVVSRRIVRPRPTAP